MKVGFDAGFRKLVLRILRMRRQCIASAAGRFSQHVPATYGYFGPFCPPVLLALFPHIDRGFLPLSACGSLSLQSQNGDGFGQTSPILLAMAHDPLVQPQMASGKGSIVYAEDQHAGWITANPGQRAGPRSTCD